MAQDRRSIIIPLLILSFIFFSPDPAARNAAARFDERPTIEDVIAEEERSLGALQNSSLGDLGSQYGHVLNLTGLEPETAYAWDALPTVKERAREKVRYALDDAGTGALDGGGDGVGGLPALYSNVTGYVHGKWTRSKLQESIAPPQLNLSAYAPEGPFGRLQSRPFGRNITGSEGDVRLRFHERTPYSHDSIQDGMDVTGISAEMTVQDSSSGEDVDLQLYGVYFTRLGQVIMTTTSEKMAGIFMLPHFTLSNITFEAARTYINDSISSTLARQRSGDVVSYNPWPSKIDGTPQGVMDSPDCEMILYLQQLPPSGLSAVSSTPSFLSFLENELRFPTGAFLPQVPEIRFTMLAFSPDCGYVLESKGEPDFVPSEGEHLTGPKIEDLYQRGRKHLLIYTGVLGLQLWFFMRQMQASSTPSTRSRISFYTVAMLALGDGFATMTFLLISLFVHGLWISLMATAFVSFIGVSFFGMRFLLDIWTVQAPERARRARAELEEERAREGRFREALERIRSERVAREQEQRQAAAGEDGEQGVDATTGQQTTDTAPPNTAPPVPDPTVTTNTPPTTANTGVDMNQWGVGPLQGVPGALPLPVTAARPPTDTGATPVFMPSDQEGLEAVAQPVNQAITDEALAPRMSSFGSIYTRFYLLLLATLFFSLNASGWPAAARRVYFTFLGFCHLSFWIPQVLRNIERNGRKPFSWEFVLGQSLLRLAPFSYFYCYEQNVLFAQRDYISFGILAVWLWIQVLILGSQELIGPRWFIKKTWAPPAYDYHPVLREDEEGAAMPIGFHPPTSDSAPTSPFIERRASLGSPISRRNSVKDAAVKEKDTARGKGKRVFDCAICFQDLEVPVIEADGSSDASLAGGLLARRQYMVTPCRHIFHSACLEGWMKYRLQCPICREGLPPL